MSQPNLIYIFADQLRYQSVGYNGDTLAKTPNIDAFAKESTVMDNAVSGHPVCAPYRASLLTGKYTTSTGMVINEIRISQNHITFPNVLRENGYETCYIGKWHLWANVWGDHFNPDNSYIPEGQRLGFDDFFAGFNFHHDYYSPLAYYHLNSKDKIYYDGYEPDCQTDMAIEHLTRLSENNKPFALFLSLGTPHDPWIKENVPEKYYELFKNHPFPHPENYLPENDPYADDWAKLSERERQELEDWRRVYYAMVANLDDNFGKLVNAIDNLGLRDNSIVIFTSDHGELFGAHGRRAKNIFYEEAVRVPYLIRGKQFIPSVCDANFNTVDIMPTLLSYMNLPIPETVEGLNKKDEIQGNTVSDEG
ncbi:MAG: sulfatase, partial [Clostridia bacterium]|nr:sulfatase [Clostridia bacterium]